MFRLTVKIKECVMMKLRTGSQTREEICVYPVGITLVLIIGNILRGCAIWNEPKSLACATKLEKGTLEGEHK